MSWSVCNISGRYWCGEVVIGWGDVNNGSYCEGPVFEKTGLWSFVKTAWVKQFMFYRLRITAAKILVSHWISSDSKIFMIFYLHRG